LRCNLIPLTLLQEVDEGSTSIFDAAAEALSDYGEHKLSPPEGEDALAVIMEKLYQKGLQQKRYKVRVPRLWYYHC
jgi:hypothetical protein